MLFPKSLAIFVAFAFGVVTILALPITSNPLDLDKPQANAGSSQSLIDIVTHDRNDEGCPLNKAMVVNVVWNPDKATQR